MRFATPLLLLLLLSLSACAVAEAQTTIRPPLLASAMSGHFHHDPYSSVFEYDRAGVDARNVLVGALFQNPYSSRGQRFAYGFVLRSNTNINNPTVRFYVDSSGYWTLSAGSRFHSGNAWAYMNSYAYGLNGLMVTLVGNNAEVYLNGYQLQSSQGHKRMALDPRTAKGDVWIVNGPWTNTVQMGATTHYDLFRVWASSRFLTGNELDEPFLEEPFDDESKELWKDSLVPADILTEYSPVLGGQMDTHAERQDSVPHEHD